MPSIVSLAASLCGWISVEDEEEERPGRKDTLIVHRTGESVGEEREGERHSVLLIIRRTEMERRNHKIHPGLSWRGNWISCWERRRGVLSLRCALFWLFSCSLFWWRDTGGLMNSATDRRLQVLVHQCNSCSSQRERTDDCFSPALCSFPLGCINHCDWRSDFTWLGCSLYSQYRFPSKKTSPSLHTLILPGSTTAFLCSLRRSLHSLVLIPLMLMCLWPNWPNQIQKQRTQTYVESMLYSTRSKSMHWLLLSPREQQKFVCPLTHSLLCWV